MDGHVTAFFDLLMSTVLLEESLSGFQIPEAMSCGYLLVGGQTMD